MYEKVLVTGGCGFIGSTLVRILCSKGVRVINVDALTYAADTAQLSNIQDSSLYVFEKANICDAKKMEELIFLYKPDAIIHLAAESHVDRSIDGPASFIHTNIMGTYTLLEVATKYWRSLSSPVSENFRFHHVSTDEVFGSLGESGYFDENSPYRPNSPYSASKAASDHLVRAWGETYGLPVVLSNCSNNYGPYQFPEKLIPLTIIRGLLKQPILVYGNGQNVRDWIHVEDHVNALLTILFKGRIGESYNVGANMELTNIEIVSKICSYLDIMLPDSSCYPHQQLITFTNDRPAHDFRYAIDASKVQQELSWSPQYSFEEGISSTVKWYLENRDWWQSILDRGYDGRRLGLLSSKKEEVL